MFRTLFFGLMVFAPTHAISQDIPATIPTIAVVGRGQAEAAPDTFRVHADTEGRGQSQVDALRNLAESQTVLYRDLRNLEGLRHARVSSASPIVQPVFDPACITERTPDRLACPIIGYIARMGVTLEGSPAERAGAAVSLAAERGSINTRLDSAFLSSDRDLHALARQAAFADARRQAEALATAAGQRLGRILRIQDPQGSASPPPPAPPRPAVIGIETGQGPSIPLDYAPPPVRASAAVTVIFEIE